MTRRVAILGATGLVGRTMLAILEEREFPVDAPRLLASDRSAGSTMRFRGTSLEVEAVGPESFRSVDLALFASANAVSQEWAPVARAAGATVIDNSSAFRYDDDVPLVVPEVNSGALEGRPTLIANPNCSTIAIVLPLAALMRAASLKRIVVSTYQSVSGAGSEALDELERGVRAGLDGAPFVGGRAPVAWNVVPEIDRFEDNGYTREEMKIVWESRKILGLPGLGVTATAVRVPVRVGHGVAVTASFARPIDPGEARALWREFPGVEVVDDPLRHEYPTPLGCAGRDPVLVGRARRDLSDANGLVFFVASDNLRKGAALNAVQIAERVCRPAETV